MRNAGRHDATARMVTIRTGGGIPSVDDFSHAGPLPGYFPGGVRCAAELRENPAGVDVGPLSPEEMENMRALGRAVHG